MRSTAEVRRFDLRFRDRDLERSFWTEYTDANLTQIRAAIAIGLVLYATFSVLVRLRVDLTTTDSVLRFGVAVPLIGATLITSWTALFRRAWQPWLALDLFVAASVIVLSWAYTPEIPTTWNLAGTLVLLAYTYSFTRLGWVAAGITGISILITYVVIAAATERMSPARIAYASFFLLAMVVTGTTTSYLLERSARLLFVRDRELAEERARSERLLHNTFPDAIVARLKTEPSGLAESNPDVSVLFADLVGFTSHVAAVAPERVVKMLGEVFTLLDGLASRFGLEKIKTVGDAYMAVAGAPDARADHVEAAADMALAIVEELQDLRWPNGDPVQVRVGLACGPVVSGVIGQLRFAYDLWGDTVNLASRLESSGAPGRIQVSDPVHARLGDRYRFSAERMVELKGKGLTRTWFLEERAAGSTP